MSEHTVEGAARAVNPNWPDNLFSVMFIPLTRGKFAVIDQSDYPAIDGFSWVAHASSSAQKWYARAYVRGSYSTGCRYVVMHRLIVGAAEGEEVDHWNNDGRDNRRANLRRCTTTENHGNTRRSGSTGFKGVYRARPSGLFIARVCYGGKRRNLGGFATAEEAARAYDAAAITLFGQFAHLNFPTGDHK